MSEQTATIWAVEQGTYSDYHVVGVFSSEENARLVADAINAPPEEDGGYKGADTASVVAWVLDPAVDELRNGYRQYTVLMRYDGTVESVSKNEISGYSLEDGVRVWARAKAHFYKGKNVEDALNGTVWAKSEEHAIKIVNEHRARMIASGEFKAP